MNGKKVQKLGVDIQYGEIGKKSGWESIFIKEGDQGKQWHKAEIDIKLKFTDTMVSIEL